MHFGDQYNIARNKIMAVDCEQNISTCGVGFTRDARRAASLHNPTRVVSRAATQHLERCLETRREATRRDARNCESCLDRTEAATASRRNNQHFRKMFHLRLSPTMSGVANRKFGLGVSTARPDRSILCFTDKQRCVRSLHRVSSSVFKQIRTLASITTC